MLSENDPRGRCVCVACLCCSGAVDCSQITCCVAHKCDCICLRQSCCLAIGAKHLGFLCCSKADDRYSTTAKDECCKQGLCCYDLALICPPRVLCGHACKLLCCQVACALPCDAAYLGPEWSCACCGIHCCCCPGTTCGCCVPPQRCPALLDMKAPPPVKRVMYR